MWGSSSRSSLRLTKLQEIINRSGVVILDHGMSTDAESRGANITNRLWSASLLLTDEGSNLIKEVHKSSLEAGADVITTASYQATFLGLTTYAGLDRRGAESVMRKSVQVAQDAKREFWQDHVQRTGERYGSRNEPLVAASIGCYGAHLADGSEYRGDYGLTPRQIADFHRQQYEFMLETDADIIAFETVPCRLEAEALALLLSEYPPTRPVDIWVSFSCRSTSETTSGDSFASCIAALADHPSITALGVNCSPPEFVADLLASARKLTSKPLVCYPNSGETYNGDTHKFEGDHSCFDLSDGAVRWYNRGARLIGGCCRTQPRHIAEVRKRLDRHVADSLDGDVRPRADSLVASTPPKLYGLA